MNILEKKKQGDVVSKKCIIIIYFIGLLVVNAMKR